MRVRRRAWILLCINRRCQIPQGKHITEKTETAHVPSLPISLSYAITQPLAFYRIFSLVSPLLPQAPQQALPSWQPSWPL